MSAGFHIKPLVRAAGADDLADRLERAAADQVALLALTIDERAIILGALGEHEQPPGGLRPIRREVSFRAVTLGRLV